MFVLKASLAVLLSCAAVPALRRGWFGGVAAPRPASAVPPAPAGGAVFEFPPAMTPLAVPELRWGGNGTAEGDRAFVLGVVRRGEPALIRGSPCSERWAALREDFGGAWPRPRPAAASPAPGPEGYAYKLRGVKIGGDRLFCPLRLAEGQLPAGDTLRDAYDLHDLTLAEFLRRTDDTAPLPPSVDRKYLYYAGALGEDLAADLRPTSFLEVAHPDLGVADAAGASVQAVWMADDGVVANAHYDRSINFVTQVTGEKEWTIFPPGDAARLYTYPVLHPHYHSAAVDLANPRADEYFEGFSAARGWRVTARPGDVLYVPPYHPHHVRSVGFAVSSSVVSPSPAEGRCSALEDVTALPLDLAPGGKPLAERGRAVLRLLDAVAGGGDGAAAALVERLVEPRYRYHMRGLLQHTTAEMRAQVSAEGCFLPRDGGDVAEATASERQAAAAVELKLGGVRAAAGDAVADICLGNLVEKALARALGPPNVAAAVKFCAAGKRARPGPGPGAVPSSPAA